MRLVRRSGDRRSLRKRFGRGFGGGDVSWRENYWNLSSKPSVFHICASSRAAVDFMSGGTGALLAPPAAAARVAVFGNGCRFIAGKGEWEKTGIRIGGRREAGDVFTLSGVTTQYTIRFSFSRVAAKWHKKHKIERPAFFASSRLRATYKTKARVSRKGAKPRRKHYGMD